MRSGCPVSSSPKGRRKGRTARTPPHVGQLPVKRLNGGSLTHHAPTTYVSPYPDHPRIRRLGFLHPLVLYLLSYFSAESPITQFSPVFRLTASPLVSLKLRNTAKRPLSSPRVLCGSDGHISASSLLVRIHTQHPVPISRVVDVDP